MDKKIAILTCSNAGLDYMEFKHDIKVFRSLIHLGEENFVDFIDLSAENFYKRLEEDKSIFPSTSYMPLGQMIEIYEDLVKEGYTDALVIPLSKEMSGIFSAAQMGAKEVEGLNVTFFNTKTVAYPEAKMVLKAADMVKEGFDIPEIIKELEYIRDNNRIYFAVSTLTYLVKNGRLSNASGFIGGALKIKPVLTISKDGKVETVEKIRTFKKAVNRILELYFEETADLDVEPFITHANNDETKDYIQSKLLENNPKLKDIVVIPIPAGVGAHVGPKTVGLGYIIKK